MEPKKKLFCWLANTSTSTTYSRCVLFECNSHLVDVKNLNALRMFTKICCVRKVGIRRIAQIRRTYASCIRALRHPCRMACVRIVSSGQCAASGVAFVRLYAAYLGGANYGKIWHCLRFYFGVVYENHMMLFMRLARLFHVTLIFSSIYRERILDWDCMRKNNALR